MVGHTEAMLAGATVLAAANTACVVEVVNPGKASRRRDYEVKPPKYAAAGIPVFIRVELQGDDAPRVEVFNLSGQDYELVAEGKAGNVLSLDQPFPASFDPAILAGRDR
ncbi:Uma2 family endonuclease [Nonomuraea sp. NPDC049400]|uniref:Uma2 family endonuclease n=1 Tax=Nonomuraea sp. NPDC049400 TaxID=3364352 RepID=UPI0037ABB8CA